MNVAYVLYEFGLPSVDNIFAYTEKAAREWCGDDPARMYYAVKVDNLPAPGPVLTKVILRPIDTCPVERRPEE